MYPKWEQGMKYILLIFTWIYPNGDAFENEVPMQDLDECEAFIERVEPIFQTEPMLRYEFECVEKG